MSLHATSHSDARRSAPAAARNVGPILAVLDDWLPPSGRVLELASGTGEHGVAFARRFPDLEWQPSDRDDESLGSIEAWRRASDVPNLAAPMRIDVSEAEWPVRSADALVAINMVHISPWTATLGLLDGARRVLPAAGPLILYGPWIEDGVETAPSNLAFDADLRRRNPQWGLRSVAALAEAAGARDLDLVERRGMPANNIMLLLRRR